MVSMLAGEALEVQAWTLFGEGDLLPHDWQLVVLASQEALQIEALGDSTGVETAAQTLSSEYVHAEKGEN